MSSLPVTPLLLARVKGIDFLILTCLPYQITLGLITPILIYQFNANLRLFIWDELVPKPIKDFSTTFRTKISHSSTELEHSQNNIQELELQSIEIEHETLEEMKTECEITKECQPSTSKEDKCDCQNANQE